MGGEAISRDVGCRDAELCYGQYMKLDMPEANDTLISVNIKCSQKAKHKLWTNWDQYVKGLKMS